MLTLYPDGRLEGFALAMKTSGAAKVYWRRLNSKRSLPVLKWASESEYFARCRKGTKIFFCRFVYGHHVQSLYPLLRMHAAGKNTMQSVCKGLYTKEGMQLVQTA